MRILEDLHAVAEGPGNELIALEGNQRHNGARPQHPCASAQMSWYLGGLPILPCSIGKEYKE